MNNVFGAAVRSLIPQAPIYRATYGYPMGGYQQTDWMTAERLAEWLKGMEVSAWDLCCQGIGDGSLEMFDNEQPRRKRVGNLPLRD